MDWKAVGKQIAGVGLPLLANAVAPGSGTIVGLITSALGLAPSAAPDDVSAAITSNPEAVLKLKALENQHQELMAKMSYDAETAERNADRDDVAAVNATMQAEAKSEHWLQWAWRPLNGLSLAFGSFALVIGVIAMAGIAVYNKDFATLNAIPTIVMAVTAAMAVPGAVCGVTAWHRGVMQRLQVQSNN